MNRKLELYQQLLREQDDETKMRIEESIRSLHEGRFQEPRDKRLDCYDIQRGFRACSSIVEHSMRDNGA